MLPLEIILIAASFPLIGMLVLKAISIRHVTPTDALATGLAATLIAGCLFYDLGRFQYFVPVMVCVAAALALSRHAQLSAAVTSSGHFATPSRLLLAAVALGVAALLGRVPVSNFIFSIGDAGAYVNSANHLAMAGTSIQQFFPLNQVLLGIFSFVGGPALTPYGALVASMAAVWFAIALGRAYLGGWRGGWIAGSLVGLNVLAMWYGRMPFSESLMLALNIGALSYWKMACDDPPAAYRHSILFGLLVAAACLNRVTGIVWMLALSGNLVYLSLRDSKRLKPFVAAFVIAAAGYVFSIQIAFAWGPHYYATQVGTYLPWLTDTGRVVVFHAAWAIALIVASLLALFISRRSKLPELLERWSSVVTFVCFIGFLFIATVIFSHSHNGWLIVNEIKSLINHKAPQDAYYLINYFTVISIPVFFVGWYFLFRRNNPIKHESWMLFWLYAALFLMISYIRPTYGMSHDVYMYWDRYFLSDTFVVFVVVIGIGLAGIAASKWFSWFAILFAVAYLAQAAFWMGKNRDTHYLDHGYAMVSWVAHVVPSHDTLLFLDNQYHGDWVFPNIRRTLLSPLVDSYGYTTLDGDDQNGPFTQTAFTPDQPLNGDTLGTALDSSRIVYVIAATRATPAKEPLGGALPMDEMESRTFLITAKPSIRGRVFKGRRETYPITLTIYRLRPRVARVASSAHSGFYADNKWTDGDGVLSGLDICASGANRRITVNTRGNIPPSISDAGINLQVIVDGTPVEGAWNHGRTQYIAPLPNSIQCVQRVELRSNTFVPSAMGINNDPRNLGIDVKSVVVD